jgi:hypothetical protein
VIRSLVFLPLLLLSLRATAQHEPVRHIRNLSGYHAYHLPQQATAVLNEYFRKHDSICYFALRYPDRIRVKERPYATYLLVGYIGDTVTVSVCGIAESRELDIFGHTRKYWEYEGVITPLYLEAELVRTPINFEEEKQVLYRLRFVWTNLSGPDCFVFERS